MRQVNIQEAETHFSKLIDAVLHGQEVIIAMAGKPVAKLNPIDQKPVRRFGLLQGKIRVAKDFDAPLPDELLTAFEK